jgi:hypothetical protein
MLEDRVNLLVVDFDYFFPVVERITEKSTEHELLLFSLCDWAHKEAPFFINAVWQIRAEGFIRNDLPLPRTNGEQHDFWNRFRFSEDAMCFYADSNVCALDIPDAECVETVWLYDAHHDCGYGRRLSDIEKTRNVTCEDWMVAYWLNGAQLHMRYPQWRAYALDAEPKPAVKLDRAVDDGSTPDVTFDQVFVCRSGAWVPSWLDEEFLDFVADSPMIDEPISDGAEPRGFDEELSRSLAAQTLAMLEQAQAQ